MFDNATTEAGNQLRYLGQILDPTTRMVLTDAGLRPGWRVVDVAAGAGTLTVWLADQVGAHGHVTAIDIDPRHIGKGENITVLHGDIRNIDLQPGSRDAVVCRLGLMHWPDRHAILARLVEALRPGGAIVVADWDCTWRDMIRRSPSRRATMLVEMFQDALLGIAECNGADLGWAQNVPQAMHDLGLTGVTSHIDARSWTGGTGICLLHRSNSVQKEAELLAAGMSRDELVELRDVLMDPELMLSGYLMHTTVGRRPT